MAGTLTSTKRRWQEMVPYVHVHPDLRTEVRWITTAKNRAWGFNEPRYRRGDWHYDPGTGELSVSCPTNYEESRLGIGAMMPANLGQTAAVGEGQVYAFGPWRLQGAVVISAVAGHCPAI